MHPDDDDEPWLVEGPAWLELNRKFSIAADELLVVGSNAEVCLEVDADRSGSIALCFPLADERVVGLELLASFWLSGLAYFSSNFLRMDTIAGFWGVGSPVVMGTEVGS